MGIGPLAPGDQGTFMYYSLGPKLMSYGLLEKVERASEGAVKELFIQTSPLGYKFYAALQRLRLYNIERDQ